ncbi:MAG: aromatic-ring-hydroxylating dioxygenase subunit beta [Rhodospirillaceae bacterium]
MSAGTKKLVDSLTNDEKREFRFLIEEFNTEYARILDAQEIEAWPNFFEDDATYTVIARENFDEGFPVSLVWCEGKAMMRDRVSAIRSTMVFAPRYWRHFSSNVSVIGQTEENYIISESNYVVLETLMEDTTRIFQTGVYKDQFLESNGRLSLKSRQCVYDSLLIPNDMVFPV